MQGAGGKVAGSVSKKTDFVVAGRQPGLQVRQGALARRADAGRRRPVVLLEQGPDAARAAAVVADPAGEAG